MKNNCCSLVVLPEQELKHKNSASHLPHQGIQLCPWHWVAHQIAPCFSLFSSCKIMLHRRDNWWMREWTVEILSIAQDKSSYAKWTALSAGADWPAPTLSASTQSKGDKMASCIVVVPGSEFLNHNSTCSAYIPKQLSTREFKKLRQQLQRKRHELCVRLSVLRLFHVRHVV